jgi:hypothetical protein
MFSGTWENHHGSRMIICQSGPTITGVYLTRIGSDLAIDQDYPLVGLATGELIAFAVAWPETKSITAWAGKIVETENSGAELHTIWHIARETTLVEGGGYRTLAPWETFITNASIFRKVEQ